MDLWDLVTLVFVSVRAYQGRSLPLLLLFLPCLTSSNISHGFSLRNSEALAIHQTWKDPVHGLELWPCSCDLHNHNSKVSVNAQWTTPGSFITSFDILSKSPLIQRRRETRVTRAQCLMVLITEERTCRDGESSRHSCGGHPWSHFYLFQLILQPTNIANRLVPVFFPESP